jgi:hypothetical protein
MKATIHADVLEEEGEALASGSCLVLRKVCILIVGSRIARVRQGGANLGKPATTLMCKGAGGEHLE